MKNETEGVDCNRCETQERERRMAENVCYACRRPLASGDIKFVMPSRVLGARDLPLPKRLMCTNCYKRFAARSRKSTGFFARMAARRLAVRNSLLVNSVQI